MEKMSFLEFKEIVVDRIKEYLPDTFADANVQLQVVNKNNNLQLSGLTITSSNSNIAPTIYLNSFYEQLIEGDCELDEILSKIAEVRTTHEVEDNFDVEQITDLNQCRHRIMPRLVNYEMNKEALMSRPFQSLADLAVVYHIELGNSFDGSMSVGINNSILNQWDITAEELHETAITNLIESNCCTFHSMMETLLGMIPAEELDVVSNDLDTVEDRMYVVSNKNKVYGAAAILNTVFMDRIVDKIGEFLVLPSSVHETILIPLAEAEGYGINGFQEMVREVNSTNVEYVDRLSDNVYKYSKDAGLQLALEDDLYIAV